MALIRGRLGTVLIGDDQPVAIMGVINRDPQSFYQGSYYRTQRQLLIKIDDMLQHGVDIIDIGGVSSAPGAVQVSARIEERRVLGVIKAISKRWDVLISIDTQRSIIARKALAEGALIVNDVSGLKADPEMASIIKDARASCILMASNNRPGDALNYRQIMSALRKSLKIAATHNISSQQIVIDPGIGFGKPPECDLAILHNLSKYRSLGQSLLVGVSRKSFIGQVLQYPSPNERLAGSLAAVVFAVLQGAHVIRTHDVRETRDCIRLLQAIQSTSKCEP